MSIHCGKKIGAGGRYDRFLSLLRSRGSQGATTRELSKAAEDYAPGTTKSELVAMGYRISCDRERCTESGRKVFRYRLLGEPPGRETDPEYLFPL